MRCSLFIFILYAPLWEWDKAKTLGLKISLFSSFDTSSIRHNNMTLLSSTFVTGDVELNYFVLADERHSADENKVG